MSNITTYRPEDALLLGNARPVLGTAMLGDEFGTIKRCILVRTGRREEITDDAKALRILLINNPGFEIQLECCFDLHVEAPGLLEVIALPEVGVAGRVMEGATVTWEAGSERLLSIPAAQWDSLEPDQLAYRLLPGGGATPIDLTIDYDGELVTADGGWPTVDAG